MKALKISALMAAASLVSFAQNANAREFADIYTECGLGAMIAPRNEAVAAVTNVTWDLGTTAISSNITSPDTCMGGQAKTAALIYESYPSLERSLAQGRGEHVEALLTLAGCNSADHNSVVSSLRSRFAETVANPGYTDQTQYQKAESLYNLFNAVAENYSCTIG
ncbi:MAG: DUF3015 family protein [Nevskiales bacterium]